MIRLSYYALSGAFLCDCGYAWYTTKLFPMQYKSKRIKCHNCLRNFSVVIIYEKLPEDISIAGARHTAVDTWASMTPIIKREVWCKRCEEWFPISEQVKKQALCLKCDMVTNLNYAISTNKYREWTEWK